MKLWTGQAVSQFGSMVTGGALQLIAVLVLRASPLQMGFLAAASSAPVLILGLLAGAWVDRLRRRPILIAADLSRALLVTSIPVAAVLGRLSLGYLVAVAAATGALTVIFDVAYGAYLPSLVSRERSPVQVIRKVIAEAIDRREIPEQDARLSAAMVLGAVMQPALALIYGSLHGRMTKFAPDICAACERIVHVR